MTYTTLQIKHMNYRSKRIKMETNHCTDQNHGENQRKKEKIENGMCSQHIQANVNVIIRHENGYGKNPWNGKSSKIFCMKINDFGDFKNIFSSKSMKSLNIFPVCIIKHARRWEEVPVMDQFFYFIIFFFLGGWQRFGRREIGQIWSISHLGDGIKDEYNFGHRTLNKRGGASMT